MKKIPYLDNKLCTNVLGVDISQVDVSKHVDSLSYITLTKSRASTVIYNFIDHGLSIYNGKLYKRVKISKFMVGLKLGSLSITKKLGPSIHNSERNAKKMAKMRRKITARKVRKTSAPKKKTSIKKVSGPTKKRK